MTYKTKLLLPALCFGAALFAQSPAMAQNAATPSLSDKNTILFKIHNIVPEKDLDGKVLYCNIGATFFNRMTEDINNVALTLNWEDDVIAEVIDLEEREELDAKRSNAKDQRSRYTTAALTNKRVSTALKLPPIKSNQQVTLKTKVDTDRCFLLLNDVDITVNNCGTIGMNGRNSSTNKDCVNAFRYVSPKAPEYYEEFKEITFDEQLSAEDAILDSTQKEVEKLYNETVLAIQNITNTDNLPGSNN